jgi:hypothetical protein
VRRTRIRRCGDGAQNAAFKSARSAQRFLSMDTMPSHNIFNLQGIDAAYLPSRGGKRMAQCGRGSVITHPGSDCFCLPRVSLTMPARDLVGGVFGIVVKGRAAARDAARGLISFKVLFNNPTDYALWVQYTTALIVITTSYDLKIRE